MQAWFIIGPRGAVYRDYLGRHFCDSRRRECIWLLVQDHCYGGKMLEEVWGDYQRMGFRCEKRRIVG